MSELLIGFLGDDFTGSTDAMESLAVCGLRTVLFTSPPTAGQLARYERLRAFGVASTARSMSPPDMERTLRPAFAALRDLGAPIVHYKVCSTFDSSPRVGSIGRAIDVGMEVFGCRFVPVIVGAPDLGRHCVFGNLFAVVGGGEEPVRLDRHPSMSRHPVTPMDEADLRLHLSRQTDKSIALFDVRQLELPADEMQRRFDALVASGAQVILIDLLHENQLATVGSLIARHASPDRPLFVVGSSGVEAALCAHWGDTTATFTPPGPVEPIVVVSGSRSPVTAGQVQWALDHGFEQAPIDFTPIDCAMMRLKWGRSVIIDSGPFDPAVASEMGPLLGCILQNLLECTRVQRVVVAGGDTSGHVARALGIESMEMIAPLTRGAPLCRVSAPGSPADGIEMVFKGGQIGGPDFFCLVERGS